MARTMPSGDESVRRLPRTGIILLISVSSEKIQRVGKSRLWRPGDLRPPGRSRQPRPRPAPAPGPALHPPVPHCSRRPVGSGRRGQPWAAGRSLQRSAELLQGQCGAQGSAGLCGAGPGLWVQGWYRLVPPAPGTTLTRGISGSGFGASRRRGGVGEEAVNERGLYFWQQGRLFVAGTGQGDPGALPPRFAVGARRGVRTVLSTGSSPACRRGQRRLAEPLNIRQNSSSAAFSSPVHGFPAQEGAFALGWAPTDSQTVARAHSTAPGLGGPRGG